MKVKNWTTRIQDRGKWKDVDEKAITFKHYRKFSAWRRRICCCAFVDIDILLKLSKILKVPTTKKGSGWGIDSFYGTYKGEEIQKNYNGQNVSAGDKKSFVRFEVLMAVTVKIKILWDVTPYTVVCTPTSPLYTAHISRWKHLGSQNAPWTLLTLDLYFKRAWKWLGKSRNMSP